jgi:hypothetical protein
MSEKTTAELEAENQAQTETVETTEVTETKQPETQTEESPYEKQLKELQARAEAAESKLTEKEEIIENKNRAIEAQKQKLKKSTPEDELTERLLARVEERQTEKSVESRVQALTSDKAEQDVILHHYRSSIVKTGNVDNDLKMAVALTDGDKNWEQRANRAMEERREDFITGFAGSSLRGETKNSTIRNPIHAAAAEIVRAVNPKAVERLDDYFKT